MAAARLLIRDFAMPLCCDVLARDSPLSAQVSRASWSNADSVEEWKLWVTHRSVSCQRRRDRLVVQGELA
jgi:hypothetical protein